MKRINIIKFGGSVITKKSGDEFPTSYEEIEKQADKYINKKNIKRLVKELYDAYQQRPFSFILINGAGPFGHNLVHDFLKGKNIKINTIHDSVALLNSKLIEEIKKYFPVTIVPPFETCRFDGKEFDTTRLQKITEKDLENGKIISTYGDIVPARNGRLGKFEVISGDDLAVNLGLKLKAESIVMVTDVDGVFTKDPKIYDDAKLIRKLNVNNIKIECTKQEVDVTGGIASKIEKLSLAARNGIRCQIINGREPGNLKRVLNGEEIGTILVCNE